MVAGVAVVVLVRVPRLECPLPEALVPQELAERPPELAGRLAFDQVALGLVVVGQVVTAFPQDARPTASW